MCVPAPNGVNVNNCIKYNANFAGPAVINEMEPYASLTGMIDGHCVTKTEYA